ncbi:MAG: hypothetical protein QOK22_2069 [Gaiellaceae bacterium]|jgi:hypothetical protein|nr:hypothetical protein [Gaiellaceae bacterium]
MRPPKCIRPKVGHDAPVRPALRDHARLVPLAGAVKAT